MSVNTGIRRARLLLLAALFAACWPGSGADDNGGKNVKASLRPENHFEGVELALAKAAMAGDTEEVRRLIEEEGADPNATAEGGPSLLTWPMLADSAEGVEALLDHGADPNLPIPEFGSPMAIAARAEKPAFLRAMLDHGGDPDAMTDNHEPLWHVAAVHDRWENIQLLIARGADINAPAHRNPGDTLLAYYSAGQFEKAYWLLEHGADPSYRMEVAASPEAVGRQPIVDEIYWWPVDPERFPEGAEWQRKCQEFLAARGYERPPEEPGSMRQLRESRGL